MKEIKYNTEARTALIKGADALANAVKVTLGPKGRNVVIDTGRTPRITKDGVSVAKEIELEDPFENMGAQLIKSVSMKMGDDAGDGTTTTTVLAQAILHEGFKVITAGANPLDVKRGIDKAVEVAVESIKTLSRPVDDERIAQIATISANNDSEIGNLIASCIEQVTTKGVITIEDSKTRDTYTKVVEGMQFDRGYLSNYLITDNERMVCEFDNPYILLVNDKINSIKDFLHILQPVVESGKSLVIIADDFDNEVLSTLVVNRLRGGLKVCAIKAPGFGDNRKNLMQDIAISVGAKCICEKDTGIAITSETTDVLGSCEKITISKDSTIIVNGSGDTDLIQQRVSQITNDLDKATDSYTKKQLSERLAKLVGGVAVIYVGANSETEQKEKKDRVDDALCAAKAAIAEGIVPGGGTTYINAIYALQNIVGCNADENYGIAIIRKALEAPLRQIALNAGKEPGVIVTTVMDLPESDGYDAKNDDIVNMFDAGIIDPTKVTRVALENAASVVGTLLTTECVIVNKNIWTDKNS